MCDVRCGYIYELHDALQRRILSTRALVHECIENINKHNAALNAVLSLSDEALDVADKCDEKNTTGCPLGTLHGVPLLLKDNIDVQGLVTTVGSRLFADAKPAEKDAAIVTRLKAAGAVILGKTNMDELAAHVSGITSCHGATINPWKQEERRSPGGSSSGVAAALAAGFCWGGIGTDTGGSIRLPAGWCGVCGIRPTYGQVPTAGIYPRAHSLDTVGVMARSVKDVDLLLQAIADPPLLRTLCPEKKEKQASTLRIGVLPDFVQKEAEPSVAQVYTNNLAQWQNLGATLLSVEIPFLDAADVTETITTIRSYEFAHDVAVDMDQSQHKEEVHPVPLADYERGKRVRDAEYSACCEKMRDYTDKVHRLFQRLEVDFLLLPVAFSTAPLLSSPMEIFTKGRILVNLFSMTHVPTLVIPGGLTENGLPAGMQLVGPVMSDRSLLDAGIAYEEMFGPFPMPVLV